MSDKFDEIKNIMNENNDIEVKQENKKKKFPIKQVFISILVLILLFIEIQREHNFLNYKAITIPYYFNKFEPFIEIDGNYLTKSLGTDEIFSVPKLVHIECNLSENFCNEMYAQYFLDSLVLDNKEYKIIRKNNKLIEAVSIGHSLLFTMKINLTTQEVTITQEPIIEKTGNQLIDFGLRQANSKIVDAQTWKNEYLKYHYSLIDTPLLYLVNKLLLKI